MYTIPIDDAFKLLYTADFYHFLRDDNAEEYRGYRATSPFFFRNLGPTVFPNWDSALSTIHALLYSTHYGTLCRAKNSLSTVVFLGGPASYQEYLFDHRSYASLSSKHIFYWSSLGQYRPWNHRCLRLFPRWRSQQFAWLPELARLFSASMNSSHRLNTATNSSSAEPAKSGATISIIVFNGSAVSTWQCSGKATAPRHGLL